MIKSYKLTYEPAGIQHAVFDKSKATSMWTADPRFLKQLIEHFSLSAEQLDMYSDSGRAVFTSFTTKITEGKGMSSSPPSSLKVIATNTPTEVLKHPVHTSVAADKRDFQEYLVEENMHVAINLKDFKAVVAHAETANATVTARYTRPCKPLQLEYRFQGVNAEFTVMTRGQADNEEVPRSTRTTLPRQTPAPVPISATRPRDTRPSVTPSTQMPPPPPRSRSIRPLNGSSTQENLSQKASADRLAASGLSMEFDSLFVPADDDRQWDEMNEEEEPQDILGWDASGTQVCGFFSTSGVCRRVTNEPPRTHSGHLFAMRSLPSRNRMVLTSKSQTMRWVFRRHSVCLRYVDAGSCETLIRVC